MKSIENELDNLLKVFRWRTNINAQTYSKQQFIYTPNDNKSEFIKLPFQMRDSDYYGCGFSYKWYTSAIIKFNDGAVSEKLFTYETFDTDLSFACYENKVTLSLLDELIDKVHEKYLIPNLSTYKEVYYSVEILQEEDDDGWSSFDRAYLYGYIIKPFIHNK